MGVPRAGRGAVCGVVGGGAANTMSDPHPQGHQHQHDRQAAEHAQAGEEQAHDIASDDNAIQIAS